MIEIKTILEKIFTDNKILNLEIEEEEYIFFSIIFNQLFFNSVSSIIQIREVDFEKKEIKFVVEKNKLLNIYGE